MELEIIKNNITGIDVGLITAEIELCPECGQGQLIYKRLKCKECTYCNWSLCGM